uniref:Secreted protein n=1 Tax=Octopus bimaculoides TaxID=37653 RepID=A0A0L8FI28_OCTBM
MRRRNNLFVCVCVCVSVSGSGEVGGVGGARKNLDRSGGVNKNFQMTQNFQVRALCQLTSDTV